MTSMSTVRATTHFKIFGPSIYVMVEASTSYVVCGLILTSTKHDRQSSKGVSSGSYDLFKFSEITGSILKTLQDRDRDTVTVED